jgi:hypothetical protein
MSSTLRGRALVSASRLIQADGGLRSAADGGDRMETYDAARRRQHPARPTGTPI